MGGVIYIVRHGATKLNNQADTSQDRIRGWTDVPLADEGRKEAQSAGLKLKSKGIQAIVTSDLSRARETAAIIGKIVGVKPVASRGLRPWNLGTWAGTSTKEAIPKIADYARNKPDEAVPEGESFNEFKQRAFAGLADAIEANQGKVLVIVTHHRDERLYEAWEKAGRPEDLSIDMPTFLQKGDPPGGIKELAIGDTPTTPAKPQSPANGNMPTASAEPPPKGAAGKNGPSMQNRSDGPSFYANMNESPGEQSPVRRPGDGGQKATKAEAHYGLAKPGAADRCGTCKSERIPNCLKVEGPIVPAGWCQLGHSKTDGHAFYGGAEEEAQESPAEAASEDEGKEYTRPVRNPEALAHGRAIAGAKAMHAVGHISAKQRDKHIGISRAAIAKAALYGR